MMEYGDFEACKKCLCNTCYDNAFCDACSNCKFNDMIVRETCELREEKPDEAET